MIHFNSFLKIIFSSFILVSVFAIPGANADGDANDTADANFQLGTLTRGKKVCFQNAQPCVITIDANSSNCRVRFLEIRGTIRVNYSRQGRSSRSVKTHTWTGDQCKVRLNWPISDDVRGGSVSYQFDWRMTNGQSGTNRASVEAIGGNPSKDAVRSEIGNSTYEAAMYLASKFEQFDGSGYPKEGNGYGIASVTIPGVNELWNWKSNVAMGKSKLDSAFATAKQYPQTMRNGGFVNVPDFSPDQVKMQALQSLVGQNFYKPHPNGGSWVEIPERNPYADNVVRIEADVAAGNPPADW